MAEKRNGCIAILVALLTWGLMSAVAVADDPQPQVLLALTEEVVAGERAELVARVVNGEGEPLEGVSVTFWAEIEFFNTFGSVAVGKVTTDGSGVARVFYNPKTPGEITIVARVGDPETGDLQEAIGILTVQKGRHLFHPEEMVYQIRGRWDWLVQWIWLVILPAGAFTIYMVVMFLLWLVTRDGSSRSAFGPMPVEGRAVASRTIRPTGLVLVPATGGVMILIAAFVLIVAITIRPWAQVDSSWRTELNLLHSAPEDYKRTIPIEVGDEPSFEVWRPHEGFQPTTGVESLPAYVGYGCASCHGLALEGAALGVDLTDASPSDVRKALKKGPEGMPSFSSLSTESGDALVAFLTGAEPPTVAQPEPGATPIPTPAPTSPTASPEPGATPMPTPAPTSPTASPEPGATPMPTPAPTSPTASPEPGATPIPTPAPTSPTETSEPTPVPTATPTPEPADRGPVSLQAATEAITVDGDTSDWSDIPATAVTLQHIKPIPGIEMRQLDPINVNLRVAVDSERIYMLLEVPDDYDYVPDDHGLSAAMAVMFRIDDPAAPHMGTTEENQRKSLGKVDMWHWELDCGPGELSGGNDAASGNDPQCNLDDEWATRPKDFEDDGTGQAENSLAGVWEHTARSEGIGATGTWIFEMSRMLQTGDPDDAQFSSGMTAYMALAYWDADETPDGWTSEGHLQSSTGGWIEVALPALPT